MKTIKAYDVVANADWGDVAVTVDNLLKDGWQPLWSSFCSVRIPGSGSG